MTKIQNSFKFLNFLLRICLGFGAWNLGFKRLKGAFYGTKG